MSRKTFGYGGIAVVLLIIIGALTGLTFHQNNDKTAGVSEKQIEAASVDEAGEEVKNEEGATSGEEVTNEESQQIAHEAEMVQLRQVVADSHSTLNVAVGWQGHRNFSWAERTKDLNNLVNTKRPLLEGISDNDIEQDILNVVACIEKAITEQDVEGILLAHRIMHDLDYYLNGNEADGILYHVTHYGTDQNVQELYLYIH
ncbi:hypothetical protein [Alkalihalobacterium chitinilyticum]|uniref:Uncharacterized protein n=1 Tax=Alkalihalobacterium chitinilyticum TaxID=2980103 RepID=A0ABT5VJ02_9BACI|nr:hypothetical protein [Alkalihalobacterium chitinilyticum]MDE5415430.1 hypothetical protein [Alkalihalobacterium chitinilyticum]